MNASLITRALHELNKVATDTSKSLYDRALAPNDWFPNYVATYLERDVRQLLAVHDLGQFHRFVRMCAARSGQLLNLWG